MCYSGKQGHLIEHACVHCHSKVKEVLALSVRACFEEEVASPVFHGTLDSEETGTWMVDIASHGEHLRFKTDTCRNRRQSISAVTYEPLGKACPLRKSAESIVWAFCRTSSSSNGT